MINRVSVVACLVFMLLVSDQAYSQRFVPMRGFSRCGTVPKIGHGRVRPSAFPSLTRTTHSPRVGAATASLRYNACIPSCETFGDLQQQATQSNGSIPLTHAERSALASRLYYESSLGPLSESAKKLLTRYNDSLAAEQNGPRMPFCESSLSQSISPSPNLLESFEEKMTASRVDIGNQSQYVDDKILPYKSYCEIELSSSYPSNMQALETFEEDITASRVDISVRRNPKLATTIVDLGEAGDAIVIAPLDSKDASGVVIDTGLGKKSWKALQPFVPEEPTLLITHNHRDHTGNIGRLGKNFPALKLFEVGLTEAPSTTLAPESKPSFGNEVNYSYYECSNKTFNSTFLRDNRKQHNANSNSVFTRVEHEGFSYLFTGDADKNALGTAMLAYENLDFELSSNVLKWPHHAWFPRSKSAQNQLAAFLKTVAPQIVVISNIANRQSESNVSEIEEFIRRTIGPEVKIYWTTRDGTVVILSVREIQREKAWC